MKAKTKPTKETLLPKTMSKDKIPCSDRADSILPLPLLKFGNPCKRELYRLSIFQAIEST